MACETVEAFRRMKLQVTGKNKLKMRMVVLGERCTDSNTNKIKLK